MKWGKEINEAALYLLVSLSLLIILILRYDDRSNFSSNKVRITGFFLKQQRPGLNGNPFHVYKFRTMKDERDSNGELLPDHIRLTSFGRFLRKYSLDELPQLFNVVKGDISLVGPRPLLMEYLPLYTKEQAKRHDVRPGVTGWAQVNGRNAIEWEEKFKLDVWYVENQSFLLDIKILYLTIFKVLKSEGIQIILMIPLCRFLKGV